MSLFIDTFIEKTNSLIVVVNQEGLVEYVSPSAQRLLGFAPENLMGNGWWELTRKEEVESIQDKKDAVQQIITAKNSNAPYERLLKTANGGDCWVLWNTTLAEGNTLVGIGHDITARKASEEELMLKNKALEQHNKETLESIEYASRIQQAVLPALETIQAQFADAFVLFEPKDVVSGDCYFFHQKGDLTFVAAVDCTGHGVPGALMSLIANTVLSEVIVKRGLENPADILYALDEELFLTLNKKNKIATADGMDVSLAVINKQTKQMLYAGAFRPALIFSGEDVVELTGSRYPIGFYEGVEKEFICHTHTLNEGDAIYLFSDGYCDQFGGEKEKKFNRKRFKELLSSIQDMNMEEQASFLSYALRNWRQEIPQVDDILVVGLKV